jgi:uncharacterized protein
MAMRVELTSDAALVLREAADYLASDPIRHNVVFTLLTMRAQFPGETRVAVAYDNDAACGVVFQSPLSFEATMTPMPPDATDACVDALVAADATFPAITGEAATAAAFAGQWTERTKSAATPTHGQRIYEVREVTQPNGVRGHYRCAEESDRELLLRWLDGFDSDTGAGGSRAFSTRHDMLTRRLADRQFWLWVDEEPVSMAAVTTPVGGAARIQAVYTPDDKRGCGYASACVGNLSAATLEAGHRCMLYTELSNPISNSVYRRLGYHAVAEIIRYTFN